MMKCQRCGAELLDTDTFCVKCGQKVTEPAICPKCGEHLREGTRFCHKCGALVDEQIPPEDDEIPVTPQKTMDIPLDVIEKSIIMEAEQAVVKREFSEAKERMEQGKSDFAGRPYAGDAAAKTPDDVPAADGTGSRDAKHAAEETDRPERRSEPVHASRVIEAVKEGRIYAEPDEDRGNRYGDGERVPSMRRRTDREEPVREELYDGEDEEDTQEPSGGFDLTRLTMILGIVLLLVLLVAGGLILKNKLAYEFDDGDDTFTEQQEDGTEDSSGTQGEIAGKLQIIKNVNIRTQPDTENSQILGVAKSGTVYEYYELVNESWYHIRLDDGRDAYVYKEYVEVL